MRAPRNDADACNVYFAGSFGDHSLTAEVFS
jgi:hypothetical protein